ncbi:pentapeptide repeat-containing protein [Methylocystis sp. H62]|uniref:pentapeptide repeat-containing protein n=1 Tax=Methylocystis sp. H62 TaxID=2785789 RepID=UPI0018C276D9|nr:pentapeptide repeat-containing protein [Methylocystis sp. H62]MBG0793698.1 pentapeptide repeat-containing protein [Methylocystis sp. H62]
MSFLKDPPKWFAVCASFFGLFVVARAVYLIGFGSAEEVNKFIVGVGAFVGAPFLIWRTWIADRQRHIAQEELYTSLLMKAVDQLGATREHKSEHRGLRTIPHVEVRLGAIYAFEKLARDYPPLHRQITEILSAYVRQNAERPRLSSVGVEEILTKTPNSESDEEKAQPKIHVVQLRPRVDIQAALTVIGRRSEKQREIERTKVDAGDVRFNEFDFAGCYLARVNLRGLNFEESNFSRSNLEGALLEKSFLKCAFFRDAHLEGSFLSFAHLEDAILWQANLQDATLSGAYLNGADLERSHLEGANLSGANLERAHLGEACVHGADFRGAKGLAQRQLDGAYGDERTRIPKEFVRPAHWSESGLGEVSRAGDDP